MSGTSRGNKKVAEAMRERYGVDDHGKSLFHSEIAKRAGSVKNPNKGFGSSGKAVEAGRKGAQRAWELRRQREAEELRRRQEEENW